MAKKENLTLGEIPAVVAHINSMSTASAKQLHLFIFEKDDVRRNIKNLRNFDGFEFEEESEAYTQKTIFVKENFTKKDLILICTILGLNYKETKEETIKMLLLCLINLETLVNNDNDAEEEEEEGEGGEGEEEEEEDGDKVGAREDEEVSTDFLYDQASNKRCSVKKNGKKIR